LLIFSCFFKFWFGFKATWQDGKEIEVSKILSFIIIKVTEEENIKIKLIHND
jgi:hypothetical protein